MSLCSFFAVCLASSSEVSQFILLQTIFAWVCAALPGSTAISVAWAVGQKQEAPIRTVETRASEIGAVFISLSSSLFSF